MVRFRARRTISAVGAGVVLAATLALMLVFWGQSATAMEEELDLPAGTSASADPDDELDVFQTFDDVRSFLDTGTAFRVPLSWIPGAEAFQISTGKIVVEPDEHRIHILSTPAPGEKFSSGFWLMLDWDDGSLDTLPELTAGFKVENVPIEDLNNLFDLGVNDEGKPIAPIALKRGWVLFSSVASSDTIVTYTVDELPLQVLTFLGAGTPNPAISADEPVELEAGANFVAELDITQARALEQTFALAGVKEIDLVLRGTLAADASSLFGEGVDASLLQFHMTATLNALGDDPPPWLVGRTTEIEFGFDDETPFIGIGDTIETLVGDASNTFKRGVRFDSSIFEGVGGEVPLLLRFDLVGQEGEVPSLDEPFEIDLAGLFGLTSVDQITASFIISANLDLTKDDPVTAIDIEFEFVFGSTTIAMKIDTDPSGFATATFSLVDAGTLGQLANRLSGVFGVPTPELDPIGQLGVPDVTITVRRARVPGTTDIVNSVNLKGTVDVYDDVFGVEWLDLNTLTLDVTLSNRTPDEGENVPSIFGSLTAEVELGDRPWTAKVEVGGSLEGNQATIEGKISLSLGDGAAIGVGPVIEIFENQFPDLPDIAAAELADLSLREIELALVAKRAPTGFTIAFDAFAITRIPVLEVDAAMYLRAGIATDASGNAQVLFDLGLRPLTPTKLSDLVKIPGLSDKEGSGPELPAFAFVVTTGISKTPLNQLTRAGFDFYKGLHGCAQSANSCPGAVLDLKPGVNLIANLAAFPAALDPLIQALWMDPDQGLQFIGRIPFFGQGAEVGVDLQIRLPRIVPPPEVDFLTGGQLAFGVKAGTSGLETYLEGQMDTRWRRSEANPASCAGIGGELQTGYDKIDDTTIVENEYCYDVLDFAIDSGISLSTDGLKAKIAGGVIAQSGFGWEEPFGVPGVTIRKLTLALEVGFEPPSSVSFAGGFAGDIILGDPEDGGKRFFGSAAAGFAVVPAPTPAGVTVVPKFVGVRGYVSAIGVTDLARILEAVVPDAPPLQELTGLPLAELRNAEFMLALSDNESLCLTAGVFLAGELYVVDELSEPGPTPIPPVNENGCADFGALVDPDTCLSDDPDTGRRDEGCFATFFGQLSLAGIVADGRVGALDLGPIHFDDAQLTFKLTPAQQAFIVRGGMHIVDPTILAGELALSVGLTNLDFYGRVTAFGGFLAEVEGGYELGLEAPFTPTADTTLHVVLGADFDAAFRQAAAPVLSAFSDTVATTVTIYDGLKATDGDPFETLRRLPSDLAAVGVGVPEWYDDPDPQAVDLVAALDTIAATMATAGVESPTIGQLFAGIELEEPATTPGFFYDGVCYAVPPVEGIVVDGECYSVYIDRILGIGDLVPGAPGSFTEFLDTVVEPALTQALRAVGLPSGVDFGDLGDELIARINGLEAPVRLTCVDFDLDTATAAPSVSLRLAGQVFGAEFGVDVGWDFSQPIGEQATTLASELLTQLFGQPAPSACAPIGPLPGPLADVGDDIADTSFEPTLSADTIVEGDRVVVSGTYGEGLGDDDIAVIDWGDGAPELSTVGALRGGVGHTYRDDDPTATSADVKLITVTIGDTTRQVALRIRNDRPSGLALQVPDRVDEAAPLTLRGTFSDAGLDDTFAVSVTWGDGSPAETVVVSPGATSGTWVFEATHTYADDDPSLTPSDAETIRVVVRDDDLGSTAAEAVVTVDDVAPANVTIVPLLGAGERIDEGIGVTYRISWDDPGADSFTVVVEDFGDGTGTTVFSSERTIDVSHVYADDDPTGTPVDLATVHVRVVDDDRLSTTGTVDVDVHNVDPAVGVADPSGATSVSVQYSDPIGGWVNEQDGTYGIDPVVITAYDVTADTSDPRFALTATIVEQGSGDTPAALPGWLFLGSPTCVADADSAYHSTCTWELSADVPGAGDYVHTDLPPGVYEIVFTVVDDDTGTGSATLTLEVLPEDARVWYVGPTFAATDSVNDGDVDVELRATVRDISSVDPVGDPWPGDIRKANLTFVDRDVAPFECVRADDPPVEIDEVFSPFDVFDADRSIGVGTCLWPATVVEADPYTVGSVVGGYYQRDDSADDAVVTVARPLDEFITGGGYLVLTDSAGEYPGGVGTHANYGFTVKFNKKGTNLQGRATIIFRIGDRTYQVKSNAIDSLGVYPGSEADPQDEFLHAEFEAKANLVDVTNQDDPISIAGNLVLQMRMTDASEDGVADSIAFTLWDLRREGGGKNVTYTQLLQFSSNWDGNATQEMTIAGGNILVHD